MDKISPPEPIWVIDPESKKEIDVAPFLVALNTLQNHPDLPVNAGGLAAVRKVLRRLNLTVHDKDVVGFEEVHEVYYDLHIMEDMFDQTRARIVE